MPGEFSSTEEFNIEIVPVPHHSSLTQKFC